MIPKKFTTCKFTSVVIFRPNYLKHSWISFLVLSAKRADLFFIIANSSSCIRRLCLCQKFSPGNLI